MIAKPQLRGAEGTKLTMNLGDQIPVLSTVFGAQVPGGIASVPQSSFNYKDVGVNLEMTPRVTYEGEIVLDGFTVESSALGPSISVAGQDVPSFSSRKVTTKLRLREGESTLLAGLLRDEQRKILTGFPGMTNAPILRSFFGQSSDEINQSDIVMLLTPHIVRTHELTVEDLSSIYIGTQQNVGLGGPPPLIATAAERTASRGGCGRADGPLPPTYDHPGVRRGPRIPPGGVASPGLPDAAGSHAGQRRSDAATSCVAGTGAARQGPFRRRSRRLRRRDAARAAPADAPETSRRRRRLHRELPRHRVRRWRRSS